MDDKKIVSRYYVGYAYRVNFSDGSFMLFATEQEFEDWVD